MFLRRTKVGASARYPDSNVRVLVLRDQASHLIGHKERVGGREIKSEATLIIVCLYVSSVRGRAFIVRREYALNLSGNGKPLGPSRD